MASGRQFIEPIRKQKDIENAKKFLELKVNQQNNKRRWKTWRRNQFLFTFGINMALRVSDLLLIKVKDVKSGRYNKTAKKTGKSDKFTLNKDLINLLNEYILDMNLTDEDYLFQSDDNLNYPICSNSVTYLFKMLQKELKWSFNVNTHTMRKTYGYHYYKQTHDIFMLQKIMNHTSAKETQIYIGIIDDDRDKARSGFSIGL